MEPRSANPRLPGPVVRWRKSGDGAMRLHVAVIGKVRLGAEKDWRFVQVFTKAGRPPCFASGCCFCLPRHTSGVLKYIRDPEESLRVSMAGTHQEAIGGTHRAGTRRAGIPCRHSSGARRTGRRVWVVSFLRAFGGRHVHEHYMESASQRVPSRPVRRSPVHLFMVFVGSRVCLGSGTASGRGWQDGAWPRSERR